MIVETTKKDKTAEKTIDIKQHVDSSGDAVDELDVYLWRLPEVERRSGYKKTQIYKLMASGDFPRSYKIGPRARAWKSNEVIGWINTRPRVTE